MTQSHQSLVASRQSLVVSGLWSVRREIVRSSKGNSQEGVLVTLNS